jgi:hypothetical protein
MHTALVRAGQRWQVEATGVIMKSAILLLGISQILLSLLYIRIFKSISELEYRSHWHTFVYKDGEKVDEYISCHEYMEMK